MDYNDIAAMYRIMAKAYLRNKENLISLNVRIHNFACNFDGDTTQLKNALKKELKWLEITYPKKLKINHKVYANDIAEVCLSFAKAYQDAVKTIPSISYLKNKSALEFIKEIASNKIRFCYNSEEVK